MSEPERSGSSAISILRIAGIADRGNHACAERYVLEQAELAGTDLDPSPLAEVAHPQLGEPEGLQRRLGTIDLPEHDRIDRRAVGQPGRQARRRRLVSARQAQPMGDLSYRRLADTGLDEWMAHPVLPRGAKARPPVAQVVDVRTRNDDRGGAAGRDRAEYVVKLRLAVVAAVGVVPPVGLSIHS